MYSSLGGLAKKASPSPLCASSILTSGILFTAKRTTQAYYPCCKPVYNEASVLFVAQPKPECFYIRVLCIKTI